MRRNRSLGVFLLAAACLAGCGGDDPGTRVTAELLAAGKSTYGVSCAPCHGTSGKGDGPSAVIVKPRNHTDATLMDRLSDGDIARVVREGGAPQDMPYMPAQPHIRGGDLVALVAYVRSLSHADVRSVQLRATDWQ